MISATKKIIQEIRGLDKKREEILNKLDTLPGGYRELVLLNSLDDCESRVRFLNELLIEMESETMNIEIKYFTDDMEPLTYIDGKSDWIDLRAAQDMTIAAGTYVAIPLGVGMKLPEGYEAHVVPRSSTFKNFGLLQTNSMGVIDETYCGDNDQWHFPAYATRDTVVHKNDRICQFRIMEHQPTIEFTPVEHLADESRGGFGSSGIR